MLVPRADPSSMIQTPDALLPVLRSLAGGDTMTRREVVERTADLMELDEAARAELTPSGTPRYEHRISWAISFLKKAGFVDQPKRATCVITASGLEVVTSGLDAIDVAFLRNRSEAFEAWVQECRKGKNKQPGTASPTSDGGEDLDPEEALEQAHRTLQAELANELLSAIKEKDPAFFERLVVRLLVKMGYGGSFEDAAKSVGKSGDGGIDGIIKEDRLGLDAIYLQAKRYQGSVGRPAVQAFVGAITGRRANKGVFLTTGSFTKEAQEYVQVLDKTVVLIDGERLASLMIEFDLGVTPEHVYEVKRIDSDFFDDSL